MINCITVHWKSKVISTIKIIKSKEFLGRLGESLWKPITGKEKTSAARKPMELFLAPGGWLFLKKKFLKF